MGAFTDRGRIGRAVLAGTAALALVVAAAAPAAAEIRVTALPLLPGGSTGWGFAVNDRGVVVGYSGDAQGLNRAVRWAPDGGVRDLGTLPGDTQATAYAIAVDGTVVGRSVLGSRNRAVRWNPCGPPVELPGLAGSAVTRAYSINRTGVVAGFSADPAGIYQPLRWSPSGVATRLALLPGRVGGSAGSVNDAGTVSGYSVTADNVQRAVLWDALGRVRDLGGVQPGHDSSQASFINGSGVAVGNSFLSTAGLNSPYLALRWDADGRVTRLFPLPGDTGSAAFGISDTGFATGFSYTPGGVDRAVIWTPDGRVVALGGPGATQSYAIGNGGVATGRSTAAGGLPQPVRWTVPTGGQG